MGQDVAIHVRITEAIRRRLDLRAARERRSRSNMASLFIEDGLDARDARDALTAVDPQPELHRVLDRLVDTGESYVVDALQKQEYARDLEDMGAPHTTGGDSET